MPPVVLARAEEGQTSQAFEDRTGRSGEAAAGSPPAGTCSHAVVAGDTLGSIAAARLGKSSRWPEIRAANPGVKPDGLRIGSTLKLPCAITDGAGTDGAGEPPARSALLERLRKSLTKQATPATMPREAPTPAADAPEEKPAPPVWTAKQGEFLADVLMRWGKTAGWTVIVDTTDAWRLAVAFRLQAGFEPAVAELIRGMGHDGVPPRVRLYPNHVLRLGGPL